jgi:hypothetical protein
VSSADALGAINSFLTKDSFPQVSMEGLNLPSIKSVCATTGGGTKDKRNDMEAGAQNAVM